MRIMHYEAMHYEKVYCTRMSYRGSDSPNIVHPQPQGGREKKHIETIELRTTKTGSGPCHGCGPARLMGFCGSITQDLRILKFTRTQAAIICHHGSMEYSFLTVYLGACLYVT